MITLLELPIYTVPMLAVKYLLMGVAVIGVITGAVAYWRHRAR